MRVSEACLPRMTWSERTIPITIIAAGHPHPDSHGGYPVPRRDLISNVFTTHPQAG